MPHEANTPVSLERRTYSRDSDDCPESCRHLLDSIYDHLRRIEREVDDNRVCIGNIQSRLHATESRQQEQLTILVELSGEVSFMKREMTGLHAAVDRLSDRIDDQKDMLAATCGMFQRHSVDEAEYQAKQTAAIQRMTRVLLIAAGSLGALTISVATITGLLSGEMEIMKYLLPLLGLGGG